jgi:hypothetical protein
LAIAISSTDSDIKLRSYPVLNNQPQHRDAFDEVVFSNAQLPEQEEKRIKLMLVELYQDITAHLYQWLCATVCYLKKFQQRW